MLCPFYRYIDKRAAYALPPEILTYGDIFYISVPVPIFSQFNFSDAFIVLVVKIYYLISIVNIFKAICLLILFILFVLVGLATADARPNLHYDLINPADGRNYGCPEKGWRYDRNTMNRLIQEGRIIWPDNPDGRPRKKSFLNELSDNLPGFSSVFSTGVYTNTATKEIGGLFNKYLFDFPKPVEVIKQLVSQVSNTDDIILDFFSGSATTAHAVMQLNAEDGGNRRFILVQLPELCDEKSEAYKTGYKNICEIGKERIRRAGKMLKDALESSGLFVRAMKRHQDQHDSLEGFAYAEWEESPEVINAKKEMAAKLDVGFRVFKLDTSNLETWDATPIEDEQLDLLYRRMNSMIHRVKPERTDLDMIYEIMLKLGVPLTYSVTPFSINNMTACCWSVWPRMCSPRTWSR